MTGLGGLAQQLSSPFPWKRSKAEKALRQHLKSNPEQITQAILQLPKIQSQKGKQILLKIIIETLNRSTMAREALLEQTLQNPELEKIVMRNQSLKQIYLEIITETLKTQPDKIIEYSFKTQHKEIRNLIQTQAETNKHLAQKITKKIIETGQLPPEYAPILQQELQRTPQLLEQAIQNQTLEKIWPHIKQTVQNNPKLTQTLLKTLNTKNLDQTIKQLQKLQLNNLAITLQKLQKLAQKTEISDIIKILEHPPQDTLVHVTQQIQKQIKEKIKQIKIDQQQKIFGMLWSSEDLDGEVYNVAWNPSGDKLAVGTSWYKDKKHHGRVYVFDSEGNLLWRMGLVGGVFDVAWNPQGDKLAVQSYDKVYVFDSEGNLLWHGPNLVSRVDSAAWSPSGEKLAIGTSLIERMAYVFDSEGNLLWRMSLYLDGRLVLVTWSPQGDKLAASTGTRRVHVFDASGHMLWSSEDLDGEVYNVAWNPSGDKLAVGTSWEDDKEKHHGRVYVFDSEGNLLWHSPDLGGWVESVAWSPQGDKLAASTSWYDTVWHGRVHVFDASGHMLWSSEDLDGEVYNVAWSPEGTMLAVRSDDKVLIFDSEGNLLWHSPDLGGWVESVAWSPSGEKLAIGTNWKDDKENRHGRVHVFDVLESLLLS